MFNYCEEYPVISLLTKIGYTTPDSNTWPERTGSAIKRIKTNKRSSPKNDALNALLVILLNGSQPGTLEAKELIKNPPKIHGEQNQYKETPIIKQKKERIQTNSKQTQVKLYVESKLLERVKKCLDAIPPENTPYLNLMKQVMLTTVIQMTNKVAN